MSLSGGFCSEVVYPIGKAEKRYSGKRKEALPSPYLSGIIR